MIPVVFVYFKVISIKFVKIGFTLSICLLLLNACDNNDSDLTIVDVTLSAKIGRLSLSGDSTTNRS